jgi:hypothetical protein
MSETPDPQSAEAWKTRAEKLWQIIDDIDTYSDMAKSDDKLFRGLVERKQKERFEILTSDGYDLFLPGEEPPLGEPQAAQPTDG